MPVELIGRSSSHFTRVVRMFAFELGVPHSFRPVLDLASLDAATFAGNPALKLPILVDERGPLFGAENVCRELRRRSDHDPTRVIMRGDLHERLVANAEELALHAMSAEVAMIMAQVAGAGHLAPPKVSESLQRCLRHLDDNLAGVLAALPERRALSFVEVALFCLTTHLVFREVLDVSSFQRLDDFCTRFGAARQRPRYAIPLRRARQLGQSRRRPRRGFAAPGTTAVDAASVPWRLGSSGHSSPGRSAGVDMPDSPKDRARVNVNEPTDVAYWCEKFGCSQTQLRAAVKMVGATPNKIRAHLAQRK